MSHLALRIALQMPKVLIPHLQLVDNQSVGIAIREAMRSAGRPGATILKQLIRSELANSEQSTGATERSITVKYGRSKVDPKRFYLVIGVDKSHFEMHTSKIPEGQVTKLRRGRKQRGLGLFGLQTRRNKRNVPRSKVVFSRYRSETRNRNRGTKPLVRVPGKTFHMIDQTRKLYPKVRGVPHFFLRKLKAALGGSMQQIFEEKLKSLVVPVIRRELIRKYKNVLR